MTKTDGAIMVTGASGFVGQGLMRALGERGFAITPVFRRTNTSANIGKCVIVDSIDGTTDWTGTFAGIKTVVHLAARVHMLNDTAEALGEYRRVNLHGTVRLAEQAAAAGVKRLVFLSSIKVNGAGTAPGRPYTVSSTPKPDDAYGISKWEAELALAEISHRTGMEVVIIRPPLVYGPGVGANFRQLIRLVRVGLPLPLGAVRNNRRSLVAIANLVDLIIACCTHPAAAGQTFLVSDDEDVSTAVLLERLAGAMHKRLWLIDVPVRLLAGAARLAGRQNVSDRLFGSLQVDIAKTRSVLGWTPPVGLDEGLEAAVRDDDWT